MPGFASAIGHFIRPLRPGPGSTATALFGEPSITLRSMAFEDGAPMPARFTADGAGVSPPLSWSGLPPATAALALLVEDVDAPFPRPLVHLVLHAIPPTLHGLAEGAVPQSKARSRMFTAGRNSFGRLGWLPPSPVPGHGPHRYVFQVFALDIDQGHAGATGRGDLVGMMTGHVLAKGAMTAIFERA